MAYGVNVVIVQLEHAILYPECINTKTSTARCMRWEQNHLYCVAMRRSHTHRFCLARGSNKVKRFFFCQSSVAEFPGGRRTYEGWHDGKPSSWIMNVLFGVCFPFDIIGEISTWPRKNGNYGKKLLPTRIQIWTRNFCGLFVKLNVDNQYMPNASGCLENPNSE